MTVTTEQTLVRVQHERDMLQSMYFNLLREYMQFRQCASNLQSNLRDRFEWLDAWVTELEAENDALHRQSNALRVKIDRVLALAEQWRYKGEFGWGPWQEGYGPGQEGCTLDGCATELRAALADAPTETPDGAS